MTECEYEIGIIIRNGLKQYYRGDITDMEFLGIARKLCAIYRVLNKVRP